MLKAFWLAFVDGLTEKVASYKKHTEFKSWMQKPTPTYLRPELAKIDTLFLTKMAENHTLLAAHTFIAHMREQPP